MSVTRQGDARSRLLDRFKSTVCRRAFSSPEAMGYEALIGPALFRVVGPILDEVLTGTRILDVGCGGGRLASYLGKQEATEVVGVDSSASQVRRLARRGGAETPRVSAVALPFRQGAFDAVISSCSLKHWPDPVIGPGECIRVLGPGGQLVIVEIDGDSTIAEVRRFAGMTRIPPGLREAYVRFAMGTVVGVAPSIATLADVLRRVGLTTATVRKINSLPFSVAVAAVP